jgi:DNA-binding transcriptional LysR family regulator
MTDFEWYRSFIAVYRAGTVTGAAQSRFLTQPAISQHIAALESAVGDTLFRRTPRKMVPTQHGKALYSRLAPAMDSLEKLSTNLRDNAVTEPPTIRLGTPLDYFHEVGFDRLKDSNLQLQIELDDTEKMIDSLLRGKLDAVIATQQIRSTTFDYTKIYQEEFCLVAHPDFVLSLNSRQTSRRKSEIERFLLEQRWISYSTELPIIRRFWHIAFKHRPNIDPAMVVPSLLLIRKAVEAGYGLSVLPRYICQESLRAGRLNIVWGPKEPMQNDIWVVTRKVDRNKTKIEQFIELMRYND